MKHQKSAFQKQQVTRLPVFDKQLAEDTLIREQQRDRATKLAHQKSREAISRKLKKQDDRAELIACVLRGAFMVAVVIAIILAALEIQARFL